MRAALAILVCCFGCDGGSRAAPPPTPSAVPVEVMLAPSAGLPRFDIQATFGANLDPSPHVQPITAALAHARAVCASATPGLAAGLSVEVRAKRLHATARNSTATCLARTMDGTAIDDPVDYAVELRVSVS